MGHPPQGFDYYLDLRPKFNGSKVDGQETLAVRLASATPGFTFSFDPATLDLMATITNTGTTAIGSFDGDTLASDCRGVCYPRQVPRKWFSGFGMTLYSLESTAITDQKYLTFDSGKEFFGRTQGLGFVISAR